MSGSGLKFKEMMGLVGPEGSEAKRSEADRSAGSTKPATMQVAAPDPEVSEKRGRRRFMATYKARIVREAEGCREAGEVGALLRREGLYWSHLTKWRRDYRKGAEVALADDKRGRKPRRNPLAGENEKLRRALERTEKKLRQAEAHHPSVSTSPVCNHKTEYTSQKPVTTVTKVTVCSNDRN